MLKYILILAAAFAVSNAIFWVIDYFNRKSRTMSNLKNDLTYIDFFLRMDYSKLEGTEKRALVFL